MMTNECGDMKKKSKKFLLNVFFLIILSISAQLADSKEKKVCVKKVDKYSSDWYKNNCFKSFVGSW